MMNIKADILWLAVRQEIDAISHGEHRQVVEAPNAYIVITGENNADANLGVIYSTDPLETENALVQFRNMLEKVSLPADIDIPLSPELLRPIAAKSGFSVLAERIPRMILLPADLPSSSPPLPPGYTLKELQPIKKGKPDKDVLAVDRIHAKAFHYAPGAVVRMMGDELGWSSGTRIYLLEVHGVPVSTVTVVFNEKTRIAGIWSMASAVQKKGYGRILLEYIINHRLRSASIIHVLPFPGVEEFYIKAGFKAYDTFSTVEYNPDGVLTLP